MALTTVTYDSFFRYDLATKQLKFTDTTDYVSQGTAEADVTIVIKVESPISGIIYNNTNHSLPDIDPDISRDSTITIPLPLDGSGNPEQGLYTVTLQYKDTGGSPVTINEPKTFTLSYTSPVIDISMEVDCFAPLLSATDETAYTRSGITPSIVRAFEINYPASMQLAPVTGTANVLTTSTFYYVTGESIEHSSGLTSTLTYDFTGGFYLIDEVSGSEFIGVSCPADLCDIYCCLRSQYLRYKSALTTNTVKATQELAKLNQILGLAELVGLSIRCSKAAQASQYVADILEIANCDSGCSCSDGQPQLVTGLGIGGASVVVDAGTGISISAVTGGGTTTYTVSLSSTNVTKLANISATIVSAGSNVTVTPSSPVTIGGIPTITYSVAATDTVVESLFVEVGFAFQSGSVPSYTLNSQKKYGTVFRSGLTDALGIVPFIEVSNVGAAIDWQNNTVTMKVQNFFSGGSVDFYPEVQVVVERARSAKSGLTQSKRFLADIYNIDSDYFNLRFINGSLGAASGAEMDGLVSLKLIFKLQA